MSISACWLRRHKHYSSKMEPAIGNPSLVRDHSRWVFLLSEGGLVTLKWCSNNGFLAAHRRGREGRVLQVMSVLLGPHVEKLEQHVLVSGLSHVTLWAAPNASVTGLNHSLEMEKRARFWQECSWESWSYWHQETRRCVSGFGGSVWRAAWPLQERLGWVPPCCLCSAPARRCPPDETGGALGSDCPQGGRRQLGYTSHPGPESRRDVLLVKLDV